MLKYGDYLKIPELLELQRPLSKGPSHDEMLFIITHQSYELWFKQIIHEISDLITKFEGDYVDERLIGLAAARVGRIEQIIRTLTAQIDVLETMTPLDFLDFREYIVGASGFQSEQFRRVEYLIGVPNNQKHAPKPDSNSLFDVVEQWLERTPFLSHKEFPFLERYEDAIGSRLKRLEKQLKLSEGDPVSEIWTSMIKAESESYNRFFNLDKYDQDFKDGKWRFSHRALEAALFIFLYREEPILHLPYRFLAGLVEVDSHFTLWRYRHSLMVYKMLGTRVGTGGSSGYDYLESTIRKSRIFKDLVNISTLSVPRSELPELPSDFRNRLNFYYTVENKASGTI